MKRPFMKPIRVSEIRYVNTFLKRNAIAEAPFIKRLNLEESEALEGDIKPEEMLVALTKMNNGKSQGLEGYPGL
jgi:hypothetical protein